MLTHRLFSTEDSIRRSRHVDRGSDGRAPLRSHLGLFRVDRTPADVSDRWQGDLQGSSQCPRGRSRSSQTRASPAVGEIQSDGTYKLSTFAQADGALPGHHKVFIIANTADPTKIPGSTPGWTPPKDLVPKKYNNVDTSGLEATVTAGQEGDRFQSGMTAGPHRPGDL